MTGPDHEQQTTQIGPYLISQRLGTGGMGVVYLGHDAATGTVAAVKVLRPELADPRLRARMRREVAAARRVPRSCTAAVLEADLDADPPWVATEYIDGPTLEVVLLERGRLDGTALAEFAAGVAVALRTIHDHGVVHRDLKPTNVLLPPDGPRVIDFGIARVAPGSGTPPTQLTSPGDVVGTPAYMAPEQLRDQPVTPAVDVFAWGAVVTYAATGRPPFGTGRAALRAIVADPPDLGGRDELPEPLRGVVRAALRKDPAARPTAAALVARMSKVAPAATARMLPAAGGRPPAAAEPTLADRVSPRVRRRLVLAAGAAGVVAAGTAGAVAVSALLPAGPGPLAGTSLTIGAFHGWQEGIAATFLWKRALEAQGAGVTVQFADVAVVYERVAEGEFDFALDAWLPETHSDYWRAHGPDLEDLGTWYSGAALTIAVNRDAPIRSLAELADAAGEFGNRLVGIEAGAGLTRVTEERVIPVYGLSEMQFLVSSTDAMLFEVRTALDRGENVVVTLWEPHWMYDAFPIRSLADPEGALGDPEDIHAFARAGFAADHPRVASWVRDFTMDENHLRSLELVMFEEFGAATDAEYEASVAAWLDRRPDYLAQLTAG